MEVINKVEISPEAAFDYECCLGARTGRQPWEECLSAAGGGAKAAFEYAERSERPLRRLDKAALKRETEAYIDGMNKSGRLLRDNYFRCRYVDERTGGTLMLFLYRGYKLGLMQCWTVAGICGAEDWTEEAEDGGRVRAWLKTETADPPEEGDWAVRHRVNQILQNMETVVWEDVLEEVLNAFESKRDKEAAEKLLFLQKLHFVGRQPERVKRKARRLG